MLTAQPDGLLFDHRIELKLRGIGQLLHKPDLQLVFVGLCFHRQIHPPQLVAAGFACPEHLQNAALVCQRLGKLSLGGAVHQVYRLVDIGFPGAVRPEDDVELLQLQRHVADGSVVLNVQGVDHWQAPFCRISLYIITVFEMKCKKETTVRMSSKRGTALGLYGSMGPSHFFHHLTARRRPKSSG